MDFKNILNQIEQADPEVYEKISPRRHVLKSFGSKVAVAALPLAIGSLFKNAYGKTTSDVTDVLNFALQLEYLEYNFYEIAVNHAPGLIPQNDLRGFDIIRQNELAHVNFLKKTITTAGAAPYTPAHYAGNPYTPAGFNFTSTFTDVFTNYYTFLEVAQIFEDTGVRAYKGQAENLQGSNFLLPALQIHTIEARHASHVRLLRNRRGGTTDNPKPWITGNAAPATAVQANYDGEQNTTQLTVDITMLPGVAGNTPVNAATESFDEPLSKDQVLPLVAGFFV